MLSGMLDIELHRYFFSQLCDQLELQLSWLLKQKIENS
jgi:hypothetical protein